MSDTRIVIRDAVGAVPYWVIDESLPDAQHRFKRLTGKKPSVKASIIAFSGPFENLDSISVDDLGDIHYHKSLAKVVIQ